MGEDTLPFNYGQAGIGLTDSCSNENMFGATGLDNDGDGTVDMAVNKVEVKPADGRMERRVGNATGPENWIRLPMQAPLMWWLWREAKAAA